MILLGFGLVIIAYQVVQLIWNTVKSFQQRFSETGLDYAPEYTKTIAILFFNILLMIEIVQTIKIFSHNHIIKVRVILIVCLIAASRKMTALMATAAKAGDAYLAEGRSLIAECERTANLYAGYPSIVAQNKTLVSGEIDSMSRPAKTNLATLKTWLAYLRSVDKEVMDGVEACRDKSDKGYMKNYNQIGPLLETMLSGQ